jgi:predicted RNA binding protein YcfA (HicA-like mRNA interferase family)
LEKVGFYVDRQRGSHITMRRDDPRAEVVVPRHTAIAKGTLRNIIRKAGLTVDEFIQLL